jgi:nickel-dependent lactate racemase
MEINLNYGTSKKQLEMDDKSVIGTLELRKSFGIPDVAKAEKEVLANPIGSRRLSEIANGKKTVCVEVADYTRGTPYRSQDYNLLLPIIEELRLAGIKDENIRFLVGTGSHNDHTAEHSKKEYGEEIVYNYEVLIHDCDKNNVSLGELSTGNELLIDKAWVESDVRIITGLITPHVFAGYTGGRKGVIPGMAARETIQRNHASALHPNARIGKIVGNPISDEMMEAARKARVDFLLDIVVNDYKKVVKIVAGDLEKAFDQGWKVCQDVYLVTFKEKADVVFASAGGDPKDVSLYQAQKAVNNAELVVKEGGTIVLLAKCQDGIGSKGFGELLLNAPDYILNMDANKRELGWHTAALCARILKKCDILVVSEIPKQDLEKRFHKHAEDLDQAIEWVKAKHGENFRSYVMPKAAWIYPCPQEEIYSPS